MKLNKNITGVQHIGIPTLTMEDTVDFYEKLGFKVMQREKLEDGGNVIFLELNKLVIEVWETKDTTRKVGAIDHLALDVLDIEAAYEECKLKELNILNKNIEILPFWSNGIKYFTIEGPNKEKIEFCHKI